MPDLLTLRGRHALSPFRIAKLLEALTEARPQHAISAVSATYWHFVETARPLEASEPAILERLLGARSQRRRSRGRRRAAPSHPAVGHDLAVVFQATDIAHNCGLEAVRRIERGVAYRIAARGAHAEPTSDDIAASSPCCTIG